MADFNRQLREYYESQKLSSDRTRTILEAGRAAALRRRTMRRRWLAAAALLVVGLSLSSVVLLRRPNPPVVDQRIAAQDAAVAVMNFFSQPDYQLPRVSANPAELVQWLRERGAPEAFKIPSSLASLPSFGCQVLDVRGERVFLLCFFLDVSPAELASGAMIKKEMTVTGPDGSMMKKNRPLVHLVFAPRSAFREPVTPGTRVSLPSRAEWNFQTWSQDDIVYLIASTIPPERLAALTRAL